MEKKAVVIVSESLPQYAHYRNITRKEDVETIVINEADQGKVFVKKVEQLNGDIYVAIQEVICG